MKFITGLFESHAAADRTMTELLEKGFTLEDVSLILLDKTRDRFLKTEKGETSAHAVGVGLAGAFLGGSVGALVAGLTSISSVVVPGAAILMSGPITAVLSGLGAGAFVGSLSAALAQSGLPDEEAEHCEKEVESGKALLIVHAQGNIQTEIAQTTMQYAGARTKATGKTEKPVKPMLLKA